MCNSTDKTLPNPTVPVSGWKQAALHAAKELAVLEGRARNLRKAISAFERLAKTGEPFPGDKVTFGSTDGTYGSSETFRAKPDVMATKQQKPKAKCRDCKRMVETYEDVDSSERFSTHDSRGGGRCVGSGKKV